MSTSTIEAPKADQAERERLREMLVAYLGAALAAIPHVNDCGDVGIIAQGLRDVCERMNGQFGTDQFDQGLQDDWENEPVEAELDEVIHGIKTDVPAKLETALRYAKTQHADADQAIESAAKYLCVRVDALRRWMAEFNLSV